MIYKPQKVRAAKAGCSPSALLKHINRKLAGREKCDRKRERASKERTLMQVSVHQELPLTEVFGKRAAAATFLISTTPEPETMSDVSYLGSGKKKRAGLLRSGSSPYFSYESTFFTALGNQSPRADKYIIQGV